mmetsp:Transcript_23499/g.52179  ORF Transcript_23499/g.52179 Transcript_23499/m.52179 type:complete len:259 (-) Transcript_23499:400-1176(-)
MEGEEPGVHRAPSSSTCPRALKARLARSLSSVSSASAPAPVGLVRALLTAPLTLATLMARSRHWHRSRHTRTDSAPSDTAASIYVRMVCAAKCPSSACLHCERAASRQEALSPKRPCCLSACAIASCGRALCGSKRAAASSQCQASCPTCVCPCACACPCNSPAPASSRRAMAQCTATSALLSWWLCRSCCRQDAGLAPPSSPQSAASLRAVACCAGGEGSAVSARRHWWACRNWPLHSNCRARLRRDDSWAGAAAWA